MSVQDVHPVSAAGQAVIQAGTVEQVQAAVKAGVPAQARLRPVAGRTKPALFGGRDAAPGRAGAAAVSLLDVSGLAGILDYQPSECTFTARAGTRLADVERMLTQDGLHLPFDPPFAARGATLGGTVAAGLSGPGRFRYGGVRDFLLGVQFVDGEGRLLRGGARVVKNAAGFSLQHAFLGSLGRLGVLTELTFKVFPLPPRRMTLVADFDALPAAVDALVRLRRSTFELDALDLLPAGTLLVRLGGVASALEARASGLASFLAPARVTTIADGDDVQLWDAARELAWAAPADSTDPADSAGAVGATDAGAQAVLVKIALTPGRLVALDERLQRHAQETGAGELPRRYSGGGEVAWVAWPSVAPSGTAEALAPLHRILGAIGLQGLVLTGGSSGDPLPDPLIGAPSDRVFLGRLRQALDPRGLFA